MEKKTNSPITPIRPLPPLDVTRQLLEVKIQVTLQEGGVCFLFAPFFIQLLYPRQTPVDFWFFSTIWTYFIWTFFHLFRLASVASRVLSVFVTFIYSVHVFFLCSLLLCFFDLVRSQVDLWPSLVTFFFFGFWFLWSPFSQQIFFSNFLILSAVGILFCFFINFSHLRPPQVEFHFFFSCRECFFAILPSPVFPTCGCCKSISAFFFRTCGRRKSAICPLVTLQK